MILLRTINGGDASSPPLMHLWNISLLIEFGCGNEGLCQAGSVIQHNHLVAVDLRYGEIDAIADLAEGQRLAAAVRQAPASPRRARARRSLHVVQRDHILDHVEEFAAPLRDVVEQVQHLPLLRGCCVERRQQRARPGVTHQRLGQQQVQRVEQQPLAPQRRHLLIES
jgi:hypothetical protein